MNSELLLNQYIAPVYISTTNMVVPIANISFDYLYANVIEFATTIWQIGSVIVYTFAFIAKEALTALNNNLSITEKILLTLCFYNFINQAVFKFTYNENQTNLQKEFVLIQKQTNSLKISDKMRENWELIWAEEIKNIHNETDKKFKDIEKLMSVNKESIDEQTNSINEYQRNEQIIFQKISQLSKELKKMKKEMEKYA